MLDDDNAFAEALTELLEADGRIEVAGRAREAREGVDLVDAVEPDVVLTEIALPVMDGVDARCEQTRAPRSPRPAQPNASKPSEVCALFGQAPDRPRAGPARRSATASRTSDALALGGSTMMAWPSRATTIAAPGRAGRSARWRRSRNSRPSRELGNKGRGGNEP
jgi:CheY-like chemotaxis protein